jgi:23S rRNA (uracil1939-C5)-methyltransferase
LLDLPYPEQCQRKHNTVVDAFRAYPSLRNIEVSDLRAAPTIHSYRIRAKLVVSDDGIGLFAAGTHDIVDTPSCPVLHPLVRQTVQRLRLLPLVRLGVSSVDVRHVDDGVLITLATSQRHNPALLASIDEMMLSIPHLVCVAVSERDRSDPQVLGSQPTVVRGPDAARYTPDRHAPYHYAGPGAFTQAHPESMTQLHRDLEEQIIRSFGRIEGCRVLELYAGTGAFSLRLAHAGAHVTLVESFAPSVQLAARAATEQNLALETRIGDAAVVTQQLLRNHAFFDLIIVNPPRRGLAPAVRTAVISLQPRMALYVSCNPITLARDVAVWTYHGLRPRMIRPYDMIPLSEVVETMAVLTPAVPTQPTLLYSDPQLLVVDKPAHEKLLASPGAPGSLLERVRQTLGAPDAQPLHPMDVGQSGVCLLARTAAAKNALLQDVLPRQSSWTVLAKGIPHAKGSLGKTKAAHPGPPMRYVRQQVIAGHGWLQVFTQGDDAQGMARGLSRIGHPIVGDEKFGDRRTNQYFIHRHGLDRPFMHLDTVTVFHQGRTLQFRSELAADLQAVADDLRASAEE